MARKTPRHMVSHHTLPEEMVTETEEEKPKGFMKTVPVALPLLLLGGFVLFDRLTK